MARRGAESPRSKPAAPNAPDLAKLSAEASKSGKMALVALEVSPTESEEQRETAIRPQRRLDTDAAMPVSARSHARRAKEAMITLERRLAGLMILPTSRFALSTPGLADDTNPALPPCSASTRPWKLSRTPSSVPTVR